MKNILLYTLLFMLPLASCNDWLDVNPKTQTDEKEMFKTTEGFKNALTACYIKLNSDNLYGLSLTITNIEYLAQHWSYNKNNYRNVEDLKNYQYNAQYPENFRIQVFKEMYNTIVQANIILKNVPEYKEVIKNEDVRALVEAEALSIRAFCHMDILRLFGQMPQDASKQVALPYAKTVSTDMIPYYSYDDFTKLILEDLDAAEALFKGHDPLFRYSFEELDNFFNTEDYHVELEDEFLGFRRFRFNYYAVKAMRAILYRYMGKNTEAYTAAMEIINAVDGNGNKVLELAGKTDFDKENFALPSECILALSNYELEERTKALFDPNKPERIYLMEEQYWDLFDWQLFKTNRVGLWDQTPNNSGMVEPRLKKYKQPASSSSVNMQELAAQKQVIPLIRLSEIYLIAMESAPSLSEVNALYIPYMKARNVDAAPLKQEKVMNEIISEYRREFFGEGKMFYTYKRLGTKMLLWNPYREMAEEDYILPLPETELGSEKNKRL